MCSNTILNRVVCNSRAIFPNKCLPRNVVISREREAGYRTYVLEFWRIDRDVRRRKSQIGDIYMAPPKVIKFEIRESLKFRRVCFPSFIIVFLSFSLTVWNGLVCSWRDSRFRAKPRKHYSSRAVTGQVTALDKRFFTFCASSIAKCRQLSGMTVEIFFFFIKFLSNFRIVVFVRIKRI